MKKNRQRQTESETGGSSQARRTDHDRHGPGDKSSRYCVLGADGEVQSEGNVATTKESP